MANKAEAESRAVYEASQNDELLPHTHTPKASVGGYRWVGKQLQCGFSFPWRQAEKNAPITGSGVDGIIFISSICRGLFKAFFKKLNPMPGRHLGGLYKAFDVI